MANQITEKDFPFIKEIVESEFLLAGRTAKPSVKFVDSKFIENRKEVLITAGNVHFTTSLIGVVGSISRYTEEFGPNVAIAILHIEDRLRRYVREK